MSQPSIAIINFSSILSDTDVQTAIRAVNRQIVEDFVPTWGTGRILRLHAAAFTPNSATPLEAETVNADSVLYLVDESTLAEALGYHDLNTSDLPFGFVFVETSGPEWTITLSHEALELIVDPTVNLLVPGPDPRQANNTVLHSYEACDAVERTSYSVDGILVSNFVTPNYFTPGDAPGTRNDFLGIGVESLKATPEATSSSTTSHRTTGSPGSARRRRLRLPRQRDCASSRGTSRPARARRRSRRSSRPPSASRWPQDAPDCPGCMP